ncbi:MAG: hypothetical protein COW01_15370 [Bdellovibrionales bacterium CG12_big_fil_rev_8_21_14_0_65_38_15]|nr:MAG: hypothetical protein COW79_14535 [Bdellovibrionales bacterium CG22_combo_CG10-13_8_21_14_all_38_13]PIQ52350.1 MAG: hypothetical protein COW01_15370 [Bdellovibrionales bacterium CG12_big_fil_rev_8_21_14_0_65_38_15]PIR30435.1 MAG: hypothetical protein COV38_06700 [Bdellovibrionales bacterium CG11_big_fil_rev_8_21_14_0_20_38_13]
MQKLTIIILSLFVAGQVFASERLNKLKRQISLITSDGQKIELFFSKIEADKVQYITMDLDYELAAAEVSENNENEITLSLFVDNYNYAHRAQQPKNPGIRYKFNMGSWIEDNQTSQSVEANHISFKNGLFDDVENFKVEYTLLAPINEPAIPSVVVNGEFFAQNISEQVKSTMTVTGPMSFSPCDGCEHSDQLWIDDVNAINVDLGQYYEEDCGGTFHVFFETLFNLEAPVTFEGNITAVSRDLWEGNYWTAVPGGEIFLGNSKNLKLVPFIDSLPSRFSKLTGSSVSIEDLEGGMGIIMDVDGTLAFVYKDQALKVNLDNGDVVESFNNVAPLAAEDLLTAVTPPYGEDAEYLAEEELETLTREMRKAFVKIYTPELFCTKKQLPYYAKVHLNEADLRDTNSESDQIKCDSFLKIWKANDYAREWSKGFKKEYGKVNLDKNEISYIFIKDAPKTSYMTGSKKLVIKLKTTIYTRKHLSSSLRM